MTTVRCSQAIHGDTGFGLPGVLFNSNNNLFGISGLGGSMSSILSAVLFIITIITTPL